jgi:predicted nuclease of restriction endonuclease-like (RecB) superfamily
VKIQKKQTLGKMNSLEKHSEVLFEQVAQLIESARHTLLRTTNVTMVTTYFLIGRQIVENEQVGEQRAQYAQKIIDDLSQKLTAKFGKGFSMRNLEQMRKFYLVYKDRIPQNSSAELEMDAADWGMITRNIIEKLRFSISWSHYILLCRIKNTDERAFYEIEAAQNHWNLEELQRQFDSSLYERLVLSTDKAIVKTLATHGQIIKQPKDLIKDPLILEFMGLEEKAAYSESDLETAIINKIEKFMLELGKGFFFGGRQVRFTFSERHYRVDLVFYNRLLKCFVLIDLKIGVLTHQDLGQMQMYVNYYDRFVKDDTENSTIGIILCKDKEDAVVEITLPKDNHQIFATQYQFYLPSKEALQYLIA